VLPAQPFNERHGLAGYVAVDGGRQPRSVDAPRSPRAARHPVYLHVLARPGVQRPSTPGRIADERWQGRFDDTIAEVLDLVETSTHHPGVKRAWVEFLGERPDPLIDPMDA
jgi:chromate reductase